MAIVEDDPSVRNGLRSIVDNAPGLSCAIAVASGEEALEQIPPLEPDVVLMDIKLPGISGIACIAGLAALLPSLEILMLTVFEDTDKIVQSIRAGATGYLLKHTPGEKLIEAIQDAYNKKSPMSPEIARRIVEELQKPSPLAKLSPREREIITGMAQGLTYKEIAANLGISTETVRTHIHNMYRKLRVRSAAEAVMKVFGSTVS
mgnify:CR=1 FL=1